ncbi:hypothetical protein MKZ38_008298 [Zalerion maritima]|uniref:Uncharacterized protein n=1 Tax=Zalerion maritima TaxID=339359 RepID=A0AAD5WNP4_9PEZI|nr:hypothetical protein MKZ38_008298 [Zalerion maritima]
MKTAKNTVLCGLAFAAASSARATRREDVAAGEPCAAISDMVAEIGYDAAFPPSLAWDCLTSIPLDVNASTAFIDYILPYVSLISNVDDLGSPGPEYAVPGVDLAGGLGQIRRKAREGGYGSQFEFEAEVKSVVVRAQDGHTNLYTALTEFFAFATNTSLVSISRDGVEIPKIYILGKATI